MSSGGGGSSQTSQTQTVELPAWAREYAKETLAKTAAITDEPYKPYEGERIAEFTPTQTQTQEKIMGMDVAPQMEMATGITGAGGLASLGAGAQYGQMATDPGSMQAYMSPYMQNVVDIQQREAMRQAGIAGTQRGAQAVKSGAFGGSRQAIMEAEAGRNLQQQLGDIQGRGLQSAFEQARQAQQFQADLGLRGAGQGIQAGQMLGQLGATQFGQEKDILQAQMGVGEQQRAMDQSKLDLGYQDFLRQQQYPYQQLGFMADMVRGIPVGQTATSIYSQPGPNPLSQMAGLAGTAYYGSKIFGAAEGGSVPSFASGTGISGLNPAQRAKTLEGYDNKQLQGLMGLTDISKLAKLQVEEQLQKNAQLNRAAQMAQAGQQPQPQTTVAQEALMEMGLGGLDVPEDMVSAAGGGIIGYSEGTPPEGVQGDPRKRREGESFADYRARMFELELQLSKEREAKKESEREAERQRLLQARGEENMIPPSPFFNREPLQTPYDRPSPQAASAAQQSASQAPDDKRPVLASIPESGTVLTDAQRKELKNSENVRYVPPQTLTQEDMDEAALKRAEVDGKAPGVDYGRPAYTPGAAPAFVSPYTAEGYMSMLEKAQAPGRETTMQGLAALETAGTSLVAAERKSRDQLEKDITAAGEYGVEKEKRAKERLEGMGKKRDDAKLSFIRDVSVTLLTSPTSNFLSDLGVAVGKGGKAYDAKIEQIDIAKEKLQDSIDTIMDQRRGDKIANAKDRRAADAALSKAEFELAKALAGTKTAQGKMDMEDARAAVNTATSTAMTIATRQHATALSTYEQQQAAAREAAKPESRDAMQARITTMLASSDPAVRAQGRRLRDEAAEVTEAFTYKTPPGQITPAVDFAARQDIVEQVYKEAQERASKFSMSLEKLNPTDRAAAIQDEIDKRYGALMRGRNVPTGAPTGGGAGGAPTGGQGGMSYKDAMKQ